MPFDPAGGVAKEDIELYRAGIAQPGRASAYSAIYRGTILPAFMSIIFGVYARREFKVPTLALIGAMEPSTTLQKMGHHRGRGGNVTTETLPAEGHFLIDHRPELVARRALEFFGQGLGGNAAGG